MKNFLLAKGISLTAFLLLSLVSFAQNLIANGDFESRDQAPQGHHNVNPIVTNFNPYDDLQSWYRTPTSTSTDALYNTPDYVATDGAFDVNPATYFDNYTSYGVNFSFTPHGGKGCVVVLQHDIEQDHRYDNMITHRLASPLLAGHIYQVEYWVRRLASAKFRTSLALSLTSAKPTFDGTSLSYNLAPSPGNKVVLSGDVQDMQNWTKITGTITIPYNEVTNQWVTIGFAATNQVYDPSLPDLLPYPSQVHGSIQYAIDDVSLVDMGCAPVPSITLQQTYYNSCKHTAEYKITNYDANLTYTWVTTGLSTISSMTGNRIFVKGGYEGSFTITATNICGQSTDTGETIVDWYGCANRIAEVDQSTEESATMAHPNPASASVIMPDGMENATLLDSRGKPVRQADASGKLDVQSLPNGLYNLQMMQNGKLINQRIQVKH